jgi:hypothetical protein
MSGSLVHESLQLTCIPETVASKAVLSFQLQEQAEVVLKILNSAEEIVRVLLNEKLDAGEYHIPFDALHLPSGNYTAKMLIGTQKEVSVRNTSFQIQKAISFG